jgi:DNA-binding PadR family transcriptional regulator
MTTKTINRPLGENQRAVLAALRRHGSYHNGGGWTWSGHLSTVRILDTLVKRGLVEVIEEAWAGYPSRKVQVWKLTPAGQIEAERA